MVFFDGQNLYQHAKDAFGHHHPNYDPVKLHKAVCKAKGWRPTLVRFYTGIPNAIESPMWTAYWANRVLALKRAGVHVTTRPLRYRRAAVIDHNGDPVLEDDGQPVVSVTPQEKGIDVRLALDLVSCARKRQFDIALIFSQDQDLQEVVQEIAEIAKEQDRWIGWSAPSPVVRTLQQDVGLIKPSGSKWTKSFTTSALIRGITDQRNKWPIRPLPMIRQMFP
jgi:uncharacterized LabA/DUF88 family protein